MTNRSILTRLLLASSMLAIIGCVTAAFAFGN
jgi:hypothetical protein